MEYKKFFFLILGGFLLIAGSGCIDTPQQSTYDINWIDTPPFGAEAIEGLIAQHISPYPGAEYDNITASASGDGNALRIRVVAISNECEYSDLYEFVYRDGELIRVGYLLEAIPEPIRTEAINIATQSGEVSGFPTSAVQPSVKRILPETATKFHSQKTLISITWMDASVSALVDMDTKSVVQVWSGY